MRPLNISTAQQIVNLCNSKDIFTFALYPALNQKRYVVSFTNIYTGKNPSLDFNLGVKISNLIRSQRYDSIGSFFYDGLYYIDANIHFQDLKTALHFANKNNQLFIYDLKNKNTIAVKTKVKV